MVKPSFAREFKKYIGREDEISESEVPKISGISLLMNPTRQKIIQHLSMHPCDSLSGISRAVKISLPTSKFHLIKLCENGFVVTKKVGHKTIFHLVDMVEDDAIEILSALNDDKNKLIYLNITAYPGLCQKDITESLGLSHQAILRHISILEKLGLIREAQEGRHKRYYPTDLINNISKSHRGRIRGFKEFVIKRFKMEGLKPRIVRASEKELIIQLNIGHDVSTLKLFTKPIVGGFL